MDQADIPALLTRLASDEDAVRKMAVFKLQNSINDPSFADVFISSGGLVVLRRLIMTSAGNTLAYSLQSLTRLLEVDMGWDIFEGPSASELVERVVELIVTNPLVNILRGAMAILVALVSHPQSHHSQSTGPGGPEFSQHQAAAAAFFGFRALKPAVAVYPQFLELVVQQLHSADHALCANALMMINALIRDALTNTTLTISNGRTAEDWPKLMKRLQDLGLIGAVYSLMQSSALQDLAHPALEFQSLSKVLLRKWREMRVDLDHPDHRRSLKSIHHSSAPERANISISINGHGRDESDDTVTVTGTGRKDGGDAPDAPDARKQHDPEKWRRLGFETESPVQDFDVAGFLGMMDLADYIRRNEDKFQKLLMEQGTRPLYERCPVAKASLAVTMILYEHFEVDKTDMEDARGYQGADAKNFDKLYRPLILQWSRLHAAGLNSFFRVWKATGAMQDDFNKVAELIRIMIEQVVGQATRTKDILEVEEDAQELDVVRLRELQMEALEMAFDDGWGQHLYQVQEVLKQEALQFVKEQRVRCLLQGAWFNRPSQLEALDPTLQPEPRPWRFARLSHNRRFLHYADFQSLMAQDPGLDCLGEKVDLAAISSVVSNVLPLRVSSSSSSSSAAADARSIASGSTVQNSTVAAAAAEKTTTTTKITICGLVDPAKTGKKPRSASGAGGAEEGREDSGAGGIVSEGTGTGIGSGEGWDLDGGGGGGGVKEMPILTLWPISHSVASEWLDGLLMLLNQTPITAETNKLVDFVSDYGLRIRLLNVRMDAAFEGPLPGAGVIPSREGLDEDYFYEV